MAEEDERLVQEALHCADVGRATHWPTAANILADEVDRLRTENAQLRRIIFDCETCDFPDGTVT